ncbi:MAG: sugar-transfer associated ATP-grasp domain-containing protein, partial [Thermoanaerobaculia bacterium]
MLEVRRRLRERGVLGINRRNSAYVRLWNPRRLYPLVDDKLRTKELAIASGMPVPELYAVVTAQ